MFAPYPKMVRRGEDKVVHIFLTISKPVEINESSIEENKNGRVAKGGENKNLLERDYPG